MYGLVERGGEMKYRITAYPYAIQRGTIEVPDNVPTDEVDAYIEEYWNQIDFDAPELDYAGTDFDRHIEEKSIERF